MGIFNLFIVIPMLIEKFTFPFIYKNVFGKDPQYALMMAGFLLLLGGLFTTIIPFRLRTSAS